MIASGIETLLAEHLLPGFRGIQLAATSVASARTSVGTGDSAPCSVVPVPGRT